MPNNARLSAIVATLLVLVAGSVALAGGDPEKLGPWIGTDAVNFTLKDQNGKDRHLEELRKDGHVALVFYRSVVW